MRFAFCLRFERCSTQEQRLGKRVWFTTSGNWHVNNRTHASPNTILLQFLSVPVSQHELASLCYEKPLSLSTLACHSSQLLDLHPDKVHLITEKEACCRAVVPLSQESRTGNTKHLPPCIFRVMSQAGVLPSPYWLSCLTFTIVLLPFLLKLFSDLSDQPELWKIKCNTCSKEIKGFDFEACNLTVCLGKTQRKSHSYFSTTTNWNQERRCLCSQT